MPNQSDQKSSQSGFVAIIGRPNVGKSTLLNYLIGRKLSITSRKPQTTRHTIFGIKTKGLVQAIYVDTPGIHGHQRKLLNRHLNRTAVTALQDVDVVLFMVDRLHWTEDDCLVLEQLKSYSGPKIAVINKIDWIEEKSQILTGIDFLQKQAKFQAIVPISALSGYNLDHLETEIFSHLPMALHHYPEDQVTDRSLEFRAAEIVREKMTRQLGQELPYALMVQVESMQKKENIWHIHILIWVERQSQKGIIIGRGGRCLKTISERARVDLEQLLDSKVMLNTWVKVRKGWSDDQKILHQLGYDVS